MLGSGIVNSCRPAKAIHPSPIAAAENPDTARNGIRSLARDCQASTTPTASTVIHPATAPAMPGNR